MRLSATLLLDEVSRWRSAGTTLGRLALPGCGSPGGDVVGGRWSGGLRHRGDVREDRDDGGRPGPRLGYPQASSASAVGEPGWDVEEPVAQGLGLTGREDLRVAGHRKESGPGGQV